MKRILLAALLAMVTVAFSAPALLAGTDTGAKVALHLTAPVTKSTLVCGSNSPNATQTACSSYQVNANINQDYLVYVVVAQVDTPYVGSGVAGIEFGIEYNGDPGSGVDVNNWYWCTDGNEYTVPGPRGDWPTSGAANILTWLSCQETRLGNDVIHAVAGALAVYSYGDDYLFLTPNRNKELGALLAIADCGNAETALDTTGVTSGAIPNGYVGFGTKPGCNPCVDTNCVRPGVPVEPTTWGKIKSKY